VKGRVAR